MPLPTTSSTTQSTTPFFNTVATPPDDVRMQEWEEPHPGRRLSMPNDAPTTWGIYTGEEGRRGDMAAKGRWPEYSNPNFSFAAMTMKERRQGRGRTRDPPQQLVLKQSGQTRPEIQTAPLPRSNMRYRTDSTSREQHLPTPDPSDNTDMSGTDSDTDSSTSAGAPPRKRIALEPLDTSFRGFQLTDFSKQLGTSPNFDAADSQSFSKIGSEAAAFSVMSPDEDLYGWNAALDRKPTHNEASAPTQQQRRASKSKRSLLQRVFSPGGSPPDEMPTISPTSYAGFNPFTPHGR